MIRLWPGGLAKRIDIRVKELSVFDRRLEEEGKRGTKALFAAFAQGFRATLQIS